MLGTLMTALYFMVKALGQLGNSLFQEEPLPYLVHQPLPWQVQCVTPGRRASRDSGKGGCSRQNNIYGVAGRRGDSSPVSSSRSEEVSDPTERAAVTIQTHYRKYHQHKHGK
ncbi:uncharacterized protein LOC144325683 [Podarcis muralis]|uniref:Uncharacterized protein n=1 Tax=Podarcis lilfordi TaxID=74358 RepID=A0AA35LGG2_9SAUR|nr:KAF7235390.1hypothetical protein EYD10_17771 [Podarcis lilfordi]